MISRTRTWKHRLSRMTAATVLAISLASPTHAGDLGGRVSPARSGPASSDPATPQPQRLSNERIAERLMYSTCHIGFHRGRVVASGTGWMLDVNKRLIVTNHHVVDLEGPPEELRIFFPVKRSGEWESDPDYYVHNRLYVKGTILASSKEHDLALIQVDRLPSGVRAIPLAAKSAPRGSQIHTLGGKPTGATVLWNYVSGRVRQTGRGRHALGRVSYLLKSDIGTNGGNSGGPLINDYGELVGVHEGTDNGPTNRPIKLVAIHIDIKAVRIFLGQALPLVNPKTPAGLVDRAESHFEMGRFQFAMNDFNAAIRMNASYAPALAGRARVYLVRNDRDSALADCNRALGCNANTAMAYSVRGVVYRLMKRHVDALKDFTSAIRFEPRRGDHYYQRGLTHFVAGSEEAAHRDLVRATELAPENHRYWAERGFVARASNDYKDSIRAYTKAIQTLPHNVSEIVPLPGYLNYRGLSFLKLNERDEAIRDFKDAIDIHKQLTGKHNPVYCFNAGFAYRAKKDYRNAYRYFSTAIELNPRDAHAYYYRGLVLREMGKVELAQKDLQQAAQLDPKRFGPRRPNVRLTGKYSSGYGSVDLTQTGNSITGKVCHGNGACTQIWGTLSADGTTISFNYRNNADHGVGKLVVADGGRKLAGHFISRVNGKRDAWRLAREGGTNDLR